MNSNPLVSIILPTFNRTTLLLEAIESVFQQTYQNWELIIINDCSTDDTDVAVRKYIESDSRIKYCRNKLNIGLASSRNVGIRNAQGQYIAFLDDDDLFYPKKLEMQVSYLNSHKELAFVYSQREMWNVETNERIVEPERYVRSLSELFEENLIGVLTVMCRKESLDVIGEFDGSLPSCEDYDMWLRLAQLYPFGVIEEPLAIYRVHGTNMSSNILHLNRIRQRVLKKVPIVKEKGITYWRKKRRLSANNYRAARWCRDNSQYLKAAGYLAGAVIQYPPIGYTMAEPEPRGLSSVWILIKPYAAILWCLCLSFVSYFGFSGLRRNN